MKWEKAMNSIDFSELKEWINNWLYVNKYYHPHSKSNSIPISELYDLFDRLEKYKREECTMTENLTELDKLEKYLKENGIKYERIDTKDTHQISVPNSKDKEWDAICHYGSFGYKEGLLEIYGSIVPENIGATVEGYLTAEDVVKRIDEYEKKDRHKKTGRDCDKCIFSTRSGGCVSWNCEFIDIREAEKAWKSLNSKSISWKEMNDVISRKAAINALFELYEYQRDIDPTEAADLVRQGIYLAEKKIEKLPSVQLISEIDLIELRDRYGDEVRFVVEDMLSGEGKRWMI